MKLNLDNKYHCQLPRAGETRRQRPLTRHRAHSQGPSGRGSPSSSGSSTYNRGLPSWCGTSHTDRPFHKPRGRREHAALSRDQGRVPGKPQGGAPEDDTAVIPCPRGAPGRGSEDHIGHPMSPGSPRAGLQGPHRSSHVPGKPQGRAPEDHISHPMSPGSPRAGLRGPQRSAMAWGPFQSRLWGGGVPGPDQAIQPPHIGLGCTPSSPASPGFRQLGRRRKPGIWQGCSAGDGPHEQAS